MIYRYKTYGAQGKLTLLEDVVAIEGTTHGATWSHETPYRSLEPNPVYSTLASPGSLWFAIPCGVAIPIGVIMAINALMGKVSAPMTTLVVSLVVVLFGVLGVVTMKRVSAVDWVCFPTTLIGHRVMFAKNGPDTEKYETFIHALLERIEKAEKLS